MHGVDTEHMDQLGKQVPFSCPDCGGPLWEVAEHGPPRYRCHAGHSLSAHTLLARQDEEIEQTLWVALRTLEEKVRTQGKLSGWEQASLTDASKSYFRTRARETRVHADRLRQFLLDLGNSGEGSPDASPNG